MNKTIKILTVVLVAQLVLVVLTHIDQLKDDRNVKTHLLSLDWQQIDGIRIKSSNDAQVLLKKKTDQEWILPEYNNLPADTSKMNDLLKKFKQLQTDWPVATTNEASKRFEVSKDHFQRQIDFLQGDKLQTTLFTGTSPGYRKVHARLDSQKSIYAVELSNFLASASTEDWLQKQLLAVNLNNVKSISSADIKLTKSDKDWKLNELTDNQQLNPKVLQNYLDAFTNFQVESVLGTNLDSEQLQKIVAEVTIEFTSESKKWVFYEPKEGAYLILKAPDYPQYFKINRAEAEKITQLQRSQLVENTSASEQPLSSPAASSQPSLAPGLPGLPTDESAPIEESVPEQDPSSTTQSTQPATIDSVELPEEESMGKQIQVPAEQSSTDATMPSGNTELAQ